MDHTYIYSITKPSQVKCETIVLFYDFNFGGIELEIRP